MFSALIRKFPFKTNIFSFKTTRSIMEGEDEFLGSITRSHQKLNEYIQKRGAAEQDQAVEDYLADLQYPPVVDFPKGLEWFNVSEPLSFSKHLKGKIVLLDFFTYCCINCMHILPDLKDIENEFSVENGLVVIGVHSAKFENEKNSKNILAAVQRYNIAHPVVNDNQSFMWKNCDVHCWPTVLLLGPDANPIVMLMGEGHRGDLLLYVRNSIAYYKRKNKISNHKLPFKSAYHLLPDLKGPLLFPSKIASYFNKETGEEWLGISDTGNNRILVVKSDGTLIHQIGGNVGFKDGKLNEAQFNAPQGLAFKNNDVLFVADTDNHAVRKIDLKNNSVTTVAGVGEQGSDYKGGKRGVCQEISSPWDVCIFKSAEQQVLIIAMAGTHQIWALFLDDTIWWKNQLYTAETCICIAGSGKEENKNNQYPHAAGFAQPSGVAICSMSKEVFIADSESSSIRKLSLIDGKVSAVVGGDRNPNNLFAFGDKDGKQYDAKLQHLLGLAVSKSEDVLFVADTYNHKIKKVDIQTNTLTTMDFKNCNFNEPAGLCVSANGKNIFVADTNNHNIRIIEVNDDYEPINIKEFKLKLGGNGHLSKIDKSKYQMVVKEFVCLNSKGGKLIMRLDLSLDSLELTRDAPQNWIIDLPAASWSCVPNRGTNVQNIDVVISVAPSDLNNATIDFIFNLITCSSNTCVPKSFIIQQPVKFSPNGPTAVDNSSVIVISRSNISVK